MLAHRLFSESSLELMMNNLSVFRRFSHGFFVGKQNERVLLGEIGALMHGAFSPQLVYFVQDFWSIS